MPSIGKNGCCGVFGSRLTRLPGLEAFLGQPLSYHFPADEGQLTATAGWGLGDRSRRARRVARTLGIPFLSVEDGFLHSVGLGTKDEQLSVVVDDIGMYYSAGGPSRLERLIQDELSDSEKDRARALVNTWRSGRVSKWNHARGDFHSLPERFVAVIDQTVGDVSIGHGLADGMAFQRMLSAAIAEHPDCTVVIKIQPDFGGARKRGHIDPASIAGRSRVLVLGDEVHPACLLERAEAIYVVTSQLGFEGLLWGKPVHTFGMPFYAGWGLTRDAMEPPERRKPVPLEKVVHSALVAYPRYIDPETGDRCEVERILEWLTLQRRMRDRFPDQVHAVGFRHWKRPAVRYFLQGSQVIFHRRSRACRIPNGAMALLWGSRPVPDGLPAGVRCLRLEDGFVRSVGFGQHLVRPVSCVLDSQGIYYDGSRPSDLEHLLQRADFPPALVARAAHLRRAILSGGITKYNVGKSGWVRPPHASRVILVPGQVESDPSIHFGSPGIKTSMGLLRAVREANPDACVVYKPHPEVAAGLRPEGTGEDQARQWCSMVVTDTAMGDLLPLVDEVHVLTSLTGFEALLRGRKVTCYGQPFYSGWGLTDDVDPVARRTRRLTVDELVAGALILYSTYISRTTGKFTTPERVLAELLAWRRDAESQPVWRRALGWILHLRARVMR